MNLTDKDYATITLSNLKAMVKDYTVALTEASNDYVYNNYKNMFDKLISLQREVYNVMKNKNWYNVENAESNKIDTKCQKIEEEFKNQVS